jgi:hypothetical protein
MAHTDPSAINRTDGPGVVNSSETEKEMTDS